MHKMSVIVSGVHLLLVFIVSITLKYWQRFILVSLFTQQNPAILKGVFRLLVSTESKIKSGENTHLAIKHFSSLGEPHVL